MLEPCDGKLSRTVLRGEGSCKAPALPGLQKMKTLLHPIDDAEALLFENILLENNIPVEVVSNHDTAYNGIYQMQKGWGVLKVAESDFEKAHTIITQWKDATVEIMPGNQTETETCNNKIKTQAKSFLPLILYVVLIISLLINTYFLIDYLNYYFNAKDFNQKISDEKGNIIAVYDYSKRKPFPHTTNVYSKNGEKISTYFDKNTNGWIEKMKEYATGITWVYLDENENGITEKYFGVNQNGFLITYNDLNEDKVIESMTIENGKGELIIKCYDHDNDSIYEEIISFNSKTGTKKYQLNIE
jgi:hypothetical protein